MTRSHTRLCVAAAILALSGCASMPDHDPVQVTVVGLESMPEGGEGMEVRMLLKLRVQNPNDSQIDYDGAYVKLAVQDKTIASGVSDTPGSVARFGESVIAIPISFSVLRIVGQVVSAAGSPLPDKIHYSLEGKLDGRGFSAFRLKSQGDMQLPAAATSEAAAPGS